MCGGWLLCVVAELLFVVAVLFVGGFCLLVVWLVFSCVFVVSMFVVCCCLCVLLSCGLLFVGCLLIIGCCWLL